MPVIDSSQDHFVTAVDDDSLWTPNHSDHATWVTQLVCQLIDSGGVHDELFRLLAPVCKVKVSPLSRSYQGHVCSHSFGIQSLRSFFIPLLVVWHVLLV